MRGPDSHGRRSLPAIKLASYIPPSAALSLHLLAVTLPVGSVLSRLRPLPSALNHSLTDFAPRPLNSLRPPASPSLSFCVDRRSCSYAARERNPPSALGPSSDPWETGSQRRAWNRWVLVSCRICWMRLVLVHSTSASSRSFISLANHAISCCCFLSQLRHQAWYTRINLCELHMVNCSTCLDRCLLPGGGRYVMGGMSGWAFVVSI